MGYTHYFPHKTVTQEVWDKIMQDCIHLRRAALPKNIEIGYWDGTGTISGEFGTNRIAFNGVGSDSHESFVLNREAQEDFSFCKTARKPYDLLVCACLLAYKFHSPKTIKISSDGDREDWQPACDFVTQVFGPSYMVKLELEGGFINE